MKIWNGWKKETIRQEADLTADQPDAENTDMLADQPDAENTDMLADQPDAGKTDVMADQPDTGKASRKRLRMPGRSTGRRLLAGYMALLVCFTTYVALDTFVITRVYGEEVTSEMQTDGQAAGDQSSGSYTDGQDGLNDQGNSGSLADQNGEDGNSDQRGWQGSGDRDSGQGSAGPGGNSGMPSHGNRPGPDGQSGSDRSGMHSGPGSRPGHNGHHMPGSRTDNSQSSGSNSGSSGNSSGSKSGIRSSADQSSGSSESKSGSSLNSGNGVSGDAAASVSTSDTYKDENISVTLKEYRRNDTTVYVADVQLSSPEYLKTALAQGAYGRNVTAKTSETASNVGAVLAVNGDFYGARQSGYVIRNGTLYRSAAVKGQQDLVIYKDGSMDIINESDVTAEQLIAKGAVQTLSFGPALVQNGSVTVGENEEVGQAMASNPRTAIGYIDEGHYVFVVSDGRTSESSGLSLWQMAQFMDELGVTTAYNLDGGGSSTMYFNGQVVNNPTTGGSIKERSVSDIVYIG